MKLKSIVFICFFAAAWAQQKNEYSQEKADSLKSLKTVLLLEKASLVSDITRCEKEIDSLKSEIDNIVQKIFIKKYGTEIGTRIINKQIWKGMSTKMMKDSWGEPDKIDVNKKKWGKFEQWYYGTVTYFFKDGKLTDWEETKAK
ncbi:MAG: hypothetical protein GXX85_12815 [Ignavibacteria bacterium]|nr:hypothetical protein [Ignavibacteria bacterium]